MLKRRAERLASRALANPADGFHGNLIAVDRKIHNQRVGNDSTETFGNCLAEF
jgi:hypothetical protein